MTCNDCSTRCTAVHLLVEGAKRLSINILLPQTISYHSKAIISGICNAQQLLIMIIILSQFIDHDNYNYTYLIIIIKVALIQSQTHNCHNH